MKKHFSKKVKNFPFDVCNSVKNDIQSDFVRRGHIVF